MSTVLVLLTQGLHTHVDVIDLPFFLDWGWYAYKADNRGRLVHYVYGGGRTLRRLVASSPLSPRLAA